MSTSLNKTSNSVTKWLLSLVVLICCKLSKSLINQASCTVVLLRRVISTRNTMPLLPCTTFISLNATNLNCLVRRSVLWIFSDLCNAVFCVFQALPIVSSCFEQGLVQFSQLFDFLLQLLVFCSQFWEGDCPLLDWLGMWCAWSAWEGRLGCLKCLLLSFTLEILPAIFV